MEEIWADVVGYEGYYQVSNSGKVRSVDRSLPVNGKPGVFRKWKGANMALSHGRHYLFVNLKAFGTKRTGLIHRLVAEAFLPNPEGKPQVNHIDGNKHNNRLENLEWVTAAENNRHAFKIGLKSSKGTNHSQAKLNMEKVAEIRRLAGKVSQAELSRRFGVSRSCIESVILKKVWNYEPA